MKEINVFEESRSEVASTSIRLPKLIEQSGSQAERRFLEFFAAQIRNPGTRVVYARATGRFLHWCDDKNLELHRISPLAIAAYIEELMCHLRAPTVKLHLAAIRRLMDWLVVGQVIPMNPAASVRGPKHVVKKGTTPVLTREQTRELIDSIDIGTISGLRDRAIIGVMVYSFARVSAVVGMNVEDYFPQGRRMWFRLHEKGGKLHDVPAHHTAEEFVDAYVAAAGIAEAFKAPLFYTVGPKRTLTTTRMNRMDALRMIKRRARQAGIPDRVCCHTFRATGITAYLSNNGLLEHAQKIAAHESIRTTKLYDRTSDAVSLDEIEKIVL